MESYAGTYRLVYFAKGYKLLFKNGKCIGGYLGKGGVYDAANFFGV